VGDMLGAEGKFVGYCVGSRVGDRVGFVGN